jgi:hypothetical protein
VTFWSQRYRWVLKSLVGPLGLEPGTRSAPPTASSRNNKIALCYPPLTLPACGCGSAVPGLRDRRQGRDGRGLETANGDHHVSDRFLHPRSRCFPPSARAIIALLTPERVARSPRLNPYPSRKDCRRTPIARSRALSAIATSGVTLAARELFNKSDNECLGAFSTAMSSLEPRRRSRGSEGDRPMRLAHR